MKNNESITCFVIMPFSDTNFKNTNNESEISGKEWEWIFNNWIKKSVESYKSKNIICIRSKIEPGNFIKGIVQKLNTAEFIIADLTGQKPNVFYELGVRHGLKNGSIIITQDSKAVPSDLQSYNYLEYEYPEKIFEDAEYFSIFETNIHEQIDSVLERKFEADNPVSDFILKTKSIGNNTDKKMISIGAMKKLLKFSTSDYRGLEIAISLYKNEFPWVFTSGNSLIEFLTSKKSIEEKIDKIDKLLESLHMTFTDEDMKNAYSNDSIFQKNFSLNYAVLRYYLKELKKNLIEE